MNRGCYVIFRFVGGVAGFCILRLYYKGLEQDLRNGVCLRVWDSGFRVVGCSVLSNAASGFRVSALTKCVGSMTLPEFPYVLPKIM